MASLSALPYETRASKHRNPLARKLFQIALEKKSNVVVSADVTTSKELLDLADRTSLTTIPSITSTCAPPRESNRKGSSTADTHTPEG